MTQLDYGRAIQGIEREMDNCHTNLLNARADLAEDMGDPDLAKAFRWLAKQAKWPAQLGDCEYVMYSTRSVLALIRERGPYSYYVPCFQAGLNETIKGSASRVLNRAAEIVKHWLIENPEGE